ncbi:MAG: arylamine N-acetyltransferase [Rhodanobacter sp.]
MQPLIDLNAYLRRLGYTAPVAPDLPTLRALATAHVASIPFENLDPLFGVPVKLDLDALQRKLVDSGRGGYCFEQNALFAAALQTMGFSVSGLVARVLWRQPEDAVTAQTHMLLRVELDGSTWLADVGFGGHALTGALRLQSGLAQPTGHEPFRLLLQGDDWRMQSLVRERWVTLYHFDLHRALPIDYVVANHYVSTCPTSSFVKDLRAARTTTDRRLTLRNREFTVRRLGSEPERRTLRDSNEIRHVLEHEFLLQLPAYAGFDQRLDQLPMPTDDAVARLPT